MYMSVGLCVLLQMSMHLTLELEQLQMFCELECMLIHSLYTHSMYIITLGQSQGISPMCGSVYIPSCTAPLYVLTYSIIGPKQKLFYKVEL